MFFTIRFALCVIWIAWNHWFDAFLAKIFFCFRIHFLLLLSVNDSKRIALEILCCILIILLIILFLILATFLLLCLTHWILCHLSFLVEWLTSLAILSCIVHLVSLIAVTQPIMEVVPKLFENVHVAVLTIVSEVSTILLHAPSLSCQFRIILYTIQIPALNIRVSNWALAVLVWLTWDVRLIWAHAIWVVVTTWISILLSTSTGSKCWHIRFYQIWKGILRVLFFTLFKMHKGCSTINIRMKTWIIEFTLSPYY